MSTYYVRADGSAANKAAATSSDAASTSMNVTVFNGETFSADDVIIFSNKGGNFTTTTVTIPSAGTSGHPIIYKGETDYIPVWTSGYWTIQQSYVHIEAIRSEGAVASNFDFRGTDKVGITTKDLIAKNSINQSYQHEDNVIVVHENLYAEGAADEGISLHDTANVTVNGGQIVDCVSGAEWGGDTGTNTVTLNDVTITGIGATGKSLSWGASTAHVITCRRCEFHENPAQTARIIDVYLGTVVFENCIFFNLTDGDYYILNRSGTTSFKVLNCSFIGDGVNTCTAIFNQDTDGVYKNNYFVDCGTEAFWGTTGTIDYNGYYNSGTARGTNTTSGDPGFDANGRIQSGSSLAVNAGIGPGSDADIPEDDIDGDVRSGTTCDLGADEYVAAGGVSKPILQHYYRSQRQ